MTFIASSTINKPFFKSLHRLFPHGYCRRDYDDLSHARDKAFAYEQLVYLYALYSARLSEAGFSHRPRVFASDWVRKVVSFDPWRRVSLTSVCYKLIEEGSVVLSGPFVYLEVDDAC